jgi:hypothetical protein
LREALGGGAARVHDVVDDLLDREDVVILLFDGDRLVNYSNGFGLSPSQHELMALDVERTLRSARAAEGARASGTAPRVEASPGGRVREHRGGARGPDSCVVERRGPGVRVGDGADRLGGAPRRPALRLARTGDAARPG